MNTSIEKLLEAAGLPDNFDAFLRRVMKTLRGSDASGPDAALALIIAPGENTPGFDLAENFTLEEHARLLEISRGKRKLPEELISAGIDGAGTGGCLLARPGAGRERAAVKRLLTAAAKAISGRLSYEDRERLLTRERDTADATTHLEEVFLSLPEITMEEASRTVLDEARRLTNSPFGFAGHIEPATGHLHIPTLTDNVWKDCRVKKKNFIFKEFNGLWGWVLKNKKPLLTNTAAADPRSGGVPAGHIKISSFLAVPALAGENVLGILALANSPAGYNKADLETARKLARVYSLILKNKLAESRKAAEEQKYRSLLDTLNDLVCNLGPDGRILYVSRATERYGYKQEEVTGRHFSEFVLPADRPRVLRDFLKAAKDGKSPPVLSYRLRRKDGSYSLIEQTSTIVNDPERGTILTGSMRDLTEARRVENLISETEEKYKTLFDNANSAIFIADTGTGLLTDVNKNAEKLTGRTREELIGMHQSRLHPAGLRSHYKQVFRRHSKSPGPQLDTAQVLRKDGSLVPVIIRGATIRVGNVTYLQGIFTGISAQKKAEARLEEALSLNRQIIANAKDGVIVYDRDMRTNAGTSLP